MPKEDRISSIFDVFDRRLQNLEKDVKRLQNISSPTVPLYDSTNYPQDAVEGQVAVGKNDDRMHWHSNAAWHSSGISPDAAIISTEAAVTLSGGPPTYSHVFGYAASFPSSDPSLFNESTFNPGSGTVAALRYTKPGVYIVNARILNVVQPTDFTGETAVWGIDNYSTGGTSFGIVTKKRYTNDETLTEDSDCGWFFMPKSFDPNGGYLIVAASATFAWEISVIQFSIARVAADVVTDT